MSNDPVLLLLNLYYMGIAICISVGAVFMMMSATFQGVVVGVLTLLAAALVFIMECFSIPAVSRYIPFWQLTIGRALPLIYLSVVAMLGQLIAGAIAVALSFLLIVLHFLRIPVPPAICGGGGGGTQGTSGTTTTTTTTTVSASASARA